MNASSVNTYPPVSLKQTLHSGKRPSENVRFGNNFVTGYLLGSVNSDDSAELANLEMELSRWKGIAYSLDYYGPKGSDERPAPEAVWGMSVLRKIADRQAQQEGFSNWFAQRQANLEKYESEQNAYKSQSLITRIFQKKPKFPEPTPSTVQAFPLHEIANLFDKKQQLYVKQAIEKMDTDTILLSTEKTYDPNDPTVKLNALAYEVLEDLRQERGA